MHCNCAIEACTYLHGSGCHQRIDRVVGGSAWRTPSMYKNCKVLKDLKKTWKSQHAPAKLITRHCRGVHAICGLAVMHQPVLVPSLPRCDRLHRGYILSYWVRQHDAMHGPKMPTSLSKVVCNSTFAVSSQTWGVETTPVN